MEADSVIRNKCYFSERNNILELSSRVVCCLFIQTLLIKHLNDILSQSIIICIINVIIKHLRDVKKATLTNEKHGKATVLIARHRHYSGRATKQSGQKPNLFGRLEIKNFA